MPGNSPNTPVLGAGDRAPIDDGKPERSINIDYAMKFDEISDFADHIPFYGNRNEAAKDDGRHLAPTFAVDGSVFRADFTPFFSIMLVECRAREDIE